MYYDEYIFLHARSGGTVSVVRVIVTQRNRSKMHFSSGRQIGRPRGCSEWAANGGG